MSNVYFQRSEGFIAHMRSPVLVLIPEHTLFTLREAYTRAPVETWQASMLLQGSLLTGEFEARMAPEMRR